MNKHEAPSFLPDVLGKSNICLSLILEVEKVKKKNLFQ